MVSFSIYNERAYKNRLFKESSHWTKFSLSLSFFDLRSSLLNKKTNLESSLLQTEAYCKGLTWPNFLSKHTWLCMWLRTSCGFQKGISRAVERERLILSERFCLCLCLYHSFPSVLQKYRVIAFHLDSHFLFFTCPPIGELPKNNGCCAPCPSPSH